MPTPDTLFLEPFGGMAGDMLLAALLDLGDARFTLDGLRELAQRLVPGEATVEVERVWRGSLGGLQVTIRTPESETLPHRHYADLEALIQRAQLSSGVAQLACRVLWRLAEAEARVHDTTPDQIHFHEVGAVDTLIDVCGAALALEQLGVRHVRSSPPLVGSGTVQCAHGQMPVPAPAVAQLLRGRECRLGGGGERLTPTAAALLVCLCEDFQAPTAFRSHAIGYGAGHRDPAEGPPNLVRVQLGQVLAAGVADEQEPREGATAWLLEVNLDDMSGQEIAHAVRALRSAGALEAWTAPLFMKKDRPGTLLAALCRAESRRALEEAVFTHSASFGLRWTEVQRTECGRSQLVVEVEGVQVRVKRRVRPLAGGARMDGPGRDLFPEDDDLARLVSASHMSYAEARMACVQAASRAILDQANQS